MNDNVILFVSLCLHSILKISETGASSSSTRRSEKVQYRTGELTDLCIISKMCYLGFSRAFQEITKKSTLIFLISRSFVSGSRSTFKNQ